MSIALHTPEPVVLELKLQWKRAGRIRRSIDGRTLQFTKVENDPGVYRIMFEADRVSRQVYIGESEDRRRRAQAYQRGRAGQGTTRRVHDALKETLRQPGATARFQVAREPAFKVRGRLVPLVMTSSFNRRMVENAALVYAAMRGRAAVFNAETGRRAEPQTATSRKSGRT